jgi:hypothetical protein
VRAIPSGELALWKEGGPREYRVRVRRPGEVTWTQVEGWAVGVTVEGDTPDQPAGRFSVRFVKHDSVVGSLSPGLSAEPMNLDALGAFRPILHPGRFIEVDCRINSGSYPWRLWLKGKIQSVEWPGADVVANCLTMDGVILRAQIEVEEQRGAADPGTPIETEIQGLLTRWMAAPPTLTTIGTPGFGVGKYTPALGSLGEQARTLAQRRAWDARYRWNETAADFLYTLSLPPRDKTVADLALPIEQMFAVPGMSRSIDYVRDAVIVNYVDAAGDRQTVTRTDPASIAEYERLAMVLTEGTDSEIRTAAQANALGDLALSDLAQPLVDARYEIPFLPWIELHDLIAVQADQDHFDFDTDFAVVAVSHRVDPEGGAWTTVDVRGGAPVGQFYAWHHRATAAASSTAPAVTPVPKVNENAATASCSVVGNSRVASIRVAASTSGYPSLATVRAATAIDGQSVPATTVGALLTGLTPGQTLYFATVGYAMTGGGGAESALAKAETVFGVNTSGIADNAVTNAKIGPLAVTAAELAADAVTRAKILDGEVIDVKIAALAITNAKLALSAVDTANVVAGAITDVKVATSAITNTKIADDAITTAKIAALQITSAKIAAGAIVAGKLSAGAIDTTSLIANGIITDALIATGTITGAKIAALTISAGNIAVGTITGDRISANTITADKISAISLAVIQAVVGNLGAITANIGTVSAGQIQNGAGTFYWNLNAGGLEANIAFLIGGLNIRGNGAVYIGDDIYLSATGDATFSGTVSAGAIVAATSFTAATADFSGTLSFSAGAGGIIFGNSGLYLETPADLEIKSSSGGTVKVGNGSGPVEIRASAGVDFHYASSATTRTSETNWLPIKVNGTTKYLRLWS